MEYGIYSLVKFILIFVRISAIILTFPIFDLRTVPNQAKIAFSFFLTLAIYQTIDFAIPEIPIFYLVVFQILCGIILGFCARVVFSSFHMAGEILGFLMGFSIVNVIDPTMEEEASIISQFYEIVAVLIFFSIGGEYFILKGIEGSFNIFGAYPKLSLYSGICPELIKMTGEIFKISIYLAAPVFCVLFFLNLGLAICARTVPQINIFIVGFPLQIGIGLLFIGFFLEVFGYRAKILLPKVMQGLEILKVFGS